MPHRPSTIPTPPKGWPGAILEEARKYRNAGLPGLAQLGWHWAMMHLLPWPEPQEGTVRSAPLVVTLTSIPSRLVRLKATLNSLLRQTVAPDAIIVALPKESVRQGKYDLPPFLKPHGHLQIVRCEKDWGPATKLIPAWLADSEGQTRFLLVDDDNVYPPDFIETFLRWSDRLPSCSLGYRGHLFPSPKSWRQTGTLYGTHTREPYRVDLLTGTWGFLIRSDFLDKRALDYSGFPDGAFYVDDIWFNGQLARNGIERVLIPAKLPPLPTISAYREALGVEFNADGRYNDEVIEAFADYWETVEP